MIREFCDRCNCVLEQDAEVNKIIIEHKWLRDCTYFEITNKVFCKDCYKVFLEQNKEFKV